MILEIFTCFQIKLNADVRVLFVFLYALVRSALGFSQCEISGVLRIIC